jgi:hypothetical protein
MQAFKGVHQRPAMSAREQSSVRWVDGSRCSLLGRFLRKRMRSGDRPGLQNRRSLGFPGLGQFDSDSLPPILEMLTGLSLSASGAEAVWSL